jgi:putative tricarboxylic transport membrane protein
LTLCKYFRVLLDHLVGAREQHRRHGQSYRLGALEVDDQLEFGGLFDRKVARLGALDDPEKDFETIGLIAEQPELLVVRKDFPASNLKEFITYAKANESKLNMGHAGVGSVSYVGCLLLNSAIGIKPAMVPFTGTAPVMNAILAGQVDYDCDPVLGPLPHVRAGTVKALAIATKKRSPLLPDVPTSYEQGLPEFDCAPFYALFAPKGTPKPIIDKLADALNKGLSEEGVQKRLADLGAEIAEPERRGPKALAELVRNEITRLAPILKAATAK